MKLFELGLERFPKPVCVRLGAARCSDNYERDPKDARSKDSSLECQ